MAVWITRIDHMPVEWLNSHALGKYPLVIIPTLKGKTYENYPDGTQLTPQALRDYVALLQSHGYAVCGSQWGWGDDPVGEAEAGLGALIAAEENGQRGFDGWVFNGEKRYEGGDKSRLYTERFRLTRPHFPFGWTPEQRLSLNHDYLQLKGVCYMPQCYPLEAGGDLDYVYDWAENYGYEKQNVNCLVQAYPTNGIRPDADADFRDVARRRGYGQLTLYTGNQSLDAPDFWRDLVV